MNGAILSQLLDEVFDTTARVATAQPLTGGCIHDARKVTLTNGASFVVKLAGPDGWPMLLAEREGLAAIAATQTIATPRVIACHWCESLGHGALALEWIERGTPTGDFQDRLGAQLAALHQAATPAAQFGFARDNYLGTTPQRNGWRDRWLDFWRNARFVPQLEMARQQGLATTELLRGVEWLIEHLDRILLEPERPSLIHGDLWSGNYLCDRAGHPILIDPAAYYADREAEWGMIDWLGGSTKRMKSAYNQVWPLPAGFERRHDVYQLYHILNHVNLFGRGYLGEAMSCLQRIRKAWG